MKYTSESCPYCGVSFTEDADVVVCPECATPHHRVCWFAHGECANTEKHGTDFIWKKAENEPQATEPEKQEQQTKSKSELEIVCPDCGKACPNGTIRCPDCGAVLVVFANPMREIPLAQFRPGFDPEENINGLKSGDIALFCRTAGASYIKKFRKTTSWNWAAFLFSPFWFFYRKLHKAGAVFATIFVVLNLLIIPARQYVENASAPLMNEFYEYAEPILTENKDADLFESYLLLGEAFEQFSQGKEERVYNEILKPTTPVFILYFLIFVFKIAAALTANRLYFKKACLEIKRARSVSKDERTVQLELFRRGGTNILLGSGSYMIYTMLINAAAYFATTL